LQHRKHFTTLLEGWGKCPPAHATGAHDNDCSVAPEITWFLWMCMELEQQDSQYIAQEYQVQLKRDTNASSQSSCRYRLYEQNNQRTFILLHTYLVITVITLDHSFTLQLKTGRLLHKSPQRIDFMNSGCFRISFGCIFYTSAKKVMFYCHWRRYTRACQVK